MTKAFSGRPQTAANRRAGQAATRAIKASISKSPAKKSKPFTKAQIQ